MLCKFITLRAMKYHESQKHKQANFLKLQNINFANGVYIPYKTIRHSVCLPHTNDFSDSYKKTVYHHIIYL
jgi:hypothetical protein